MPGRLHTNFRSGNLAEQLGLLLLKGIAAVADVPRTEDVGIDAVANLLRRDPDGNCYAEEGFVVQLKSYSQTSIEYHDHELSWFLGQSQPMFIGRVSLQDSRISLYPTVYANQAALALEPKQVIIHFGRAQHLMDLYQWTGGGTDSATVWIGEPLLEWTLSDLNDRTWISSAYDIMKRFLAIARREHHLLTLGQSSHIVWAKNAKDSIQSSFKAMKGRHDNLQQVAHQCLPGINALMLSAMTMPDEGANSLTTSLITLAAALRDQGVDVGELDLLIRMSSIRSQKIS